MMKLKSVIREKTLDCFNWLSFDLIYPAALSVVKEVANHANDIMKQGVWLIHSHMASLGSHEYEWILTHILFIQDNFQKLMQVQYSLNGHHEIVQPGRVRKTRLPMIQCFWACRLCVGKLNFVGFMCFICRFS